jgi:tetratricopeptide (TPR) repeat protein
MIAGKQLDTIDADDIPATQMARLGLALLDGEIARLSGNLTKAITFFRKASDLERAIPYTEPPYWHQPVSHILGAALLAAKQPADAEAVYRDSLKSYRQDGWALYGLSQALDAQGKHADAQQVRGQFANVWQLADTKLTASRF